MVRLRIEGHGVFAAGWRNGAGGRIEVHHGAPHYDMVSSSQ